VERKGSWANLGLLVIQDRPSGDGPIGGGARAALRKAVACAEAFESSS